jgi:uncharacterized protein YodC (DUF2158 family)
MELKIGDVVRLKTGGPKMTVNAVHEQVGEAPYVTSIWFERVTAAAFAIDEGEHWDGPHTETFAVDALEKIEEASPAQSEAA